MGDTPPRSCARPFFFSSGRICLHRRHFFYGDPRTHSSLLEYFLSSLYSTPSLTRALFFSRSPAPLDLPCRRRFMSPDRLGHTPPPRSTPVSSCHLPYAHASLRSPQQHPSAIATFHPTAGRRSLPCVRYSASPTKPRPPGVSLTSGQPNLAITSASPPSNRRQWPSPHFGQSLPVAAKPPRLCCT